jgi:hypothetical protein
MLANPKRAHGVAPTPWTIGGNPPPAIVAPRLLRTIPRRNAQQASRPGWLALESNRNRYSIVENLNKPKIIN